ncbi:MAG: ISAs1 family transposase, partial [Crocinitomix sp.]|nr:ISAs1 family transposase [Crocinitomix sp.]
MSRKDKLLDFFEDLEDPRRDKCKKHQLVDIIAISVCGVICGCEAW